MKLTESMHFLCVCVCVIRGSIAWEREYIQVHLKFQIFLVKLE